MASAASAAAEALSLHRRGLTREALELARQALSVTPDHPGLLFNSAVFAAALGDTATAESCYRHVLRIAPESAEAWNNLGNILAGRSDMEQAEAAYRKAVDIRPEYANAHNNLGRLLLKTGRLAEAENEFATALRLRPDFADALNNLAIALFQAGNLDGAEEACRKAIALQADHADAWCNLGLTLAKKGKPEAAEGAYRAVLAKQAAHPTALLNLGILLLDNKHLSAADDALSRALAVDPGSFDARLAWANLRWRQGRLEEAKAGFSACLGINPRNAVAWNNLAGVMLEEGDDAGAESGFRKALAIDPGHSLASWNLSLLLLRQGRFLEGWRAYEARHEVWRSNPSFAPPPHDEHNSLPPRWSGEPLTGKNLLVWQEQGYGDEIQFVRFLPALRKLGARSVTLACKPALKALLMSQGLADRVIGTDEWRPEMAGSYDIWNYLMSLPACLQLDAIPAQAAYLKADETRVARWVAQLPGSRPRIGLAWRGSGAHAFDQDRSLPSLSALDPVLSIRGMHFVSLQVAASQADAAIAQAWSIPMLGDGIRDFADTAAIVSQLDLVIAVDTAIAHLAGAQGIHCWIMLSALHTDWRWQGDRDDSPWYPQRVRLFRQESAGDWAALARRVAAELQARFAL